MRDLRFSCNVSGVDVMGEFAEHCRAIERAGYDAVYTADHLGLPAPFPALVAAAAATERLRLGTLVLNAPFWNPALLAREIATTDHLTGGRLEVGLGVGHMRWEFEAAGVPWRPFGERVTAMTELIEALAAEFAQDGYPQQRAAREARGVPALRPAQRTGFGGFGPPLLVGGTGDRVLAVAARHADIIGVAGALQVPGQPPGTFRLATAAETDERIAFTRAAAGSRADELEWQTLVQLVAVTDDRSAAAREVAAQFEMTEAEALTSPYLLIGSVEEIARQVLANRDRYGFTHHTVHGQYREAFAPVIARARALA
jgi:probable F420-dependent oxidoreductase